MNDTDLHKLLTQLAGPSASKLPAHQQALRAQLLKTHAHQQTTFRRFLGTFVKVLPNQGVYMSKKPFAIGLSAVAISVLAVGIMMLGGPQNSASASQLIAGAKKSVQAMDPAALAAFNEKNQQDLNQRLTEAKSSSTLKVMSLGDLSKLGWESKGYNDTLKSYVGYIDGSNHQIVFGLGDDERPLFVVDVTQEAELIKRADERMRNPQSAEDIPVPAMEVN